MGYLDSDYTLFLISEMKMVVNVVLINPVSVCAKTYIQTAFAKTRAGNLTKGGGQSRQALHWLITLLLHDLPVNLSDSSYWPVLASLCFCLP